MSDKKHLTFSILVCAWEEEKMIEHCIKHILSLDYPKKNIEIIVSCDSNTAKLIREYPVKILVEKERAGKWNALTNMIKKSTGDILIINDADSFLFPLYALYDLEKDFNKNPKLGGLVFGYLKTTDEIKGNFWTFIDYLITDLSFYYRLLKYPIKDFKQVTFPILTNVFRNKIEKIEAINDDAEISLKLLQMGYELDYAPYIYFYSLHGTSTNISDFIKQKVRINTGWLQLKKKYGLDFTNYYLEMGFLVAKTIFYLMIWPLGYAYSMLKAYFKKPEVKVWEKIKR